MRVMKSDVRIPYGFMRSMKRIGENPDSRIGSELGRMADGGRTEGARRKHGTAQVPVGWCGVLQYFIIQGG